MASITEAVSVVVRHMDKRIIRQKRLNINWHHKEENGHSMLAHLEEETVRRTAAGLDRKLAATYYSDWQRVVISSPC